MRKVPQLDIRFERNLFADEDLKAMESAVSLRCDFRSRLDFFVAQVANAKERRLGARAKAAFYLGFHARIGRDSSVRALAQSTIFDPQAFRLVWQFCGYE